MVTYAQVGRRLLFGTIVTLLALVCLLAATYCMVRAAIDLIAALIRDGSRARFAGFLWVARGLVLYAMGELFSLSGRRVRRGLRDAGIVQ